MKLPHTDSSKKWVHGHLCYCKSKLKYHLRGGIVKNVGWITLKKTDKAISNGKYNQELTKENFYGAL